MSICYCPECKFEFASIHKPYSTTDDEEYRGAFSVLCTQCFGEFHVPTQYPRGIAPLEDLYLCRIESYRLNRGPVKQRLRTKYVSTGVLTQAFEKPAPFREMADFSGLPCPDCGAESLVMALGPVECPKCQRSKLVENFLE